jgi:PHP family Zn ribbon phosphoesterase
VKTVAAELHVHTVLSPCAEVEMIPPLIVRAALDRGLGLIAITDHNASANATAVQAAARGTGLTVLPGMELQTREEVHLLCLFDTLVQIEAWQARIDAALPPTLNDIELFGEQFVVDSTGDFLRREPRLLLTSADIGLERAVAEVTALGGLAIPAHVDRRAFGLFANLGFLPAGLPVPALEISRNISPAEACRKYPSLIGRTLVQGGDAHRLDEILGLNEFQIEAPSLSELAQAFSGKDGRKVQVVTTLT